MDEEKKEGLKGLLRSRKFLVAVGTVVTMILAVFNEDTAKLVDKIFGIGVAYIVGHAATDSIFNWFKKK